MTRATNPRAALYARVSTVEQAKAYGLDAQVYDLERRAKRRSYTIAGVFKDAGISGTTSDRDGLTQLLALVKRGGADVVVVPDVTRLSRDMELFLHLERQIREAGVRVECTALPIMLDDDEDEDAQAAQVLSLYQHALDGAKELRTITRRFRQGRMQKAREKGLRPSGRPSYGYMTHPTQKGLTLVHDGEAPHVVQMFERVTAGWTLHAIARELDRTGIRTRSGRPWSLSTLHGILTNEVYIGRGYYNRSKQPRGGKKSIRAPEQWIPIPTPALVSEATFHAVQARMAENARAHSLHRPTDSQYFLRRLLRCETCGRALIGHTVNGQRRYYECTTPRCRPAEPAARLEARVWALVEEMTDPRRLAARLAADVRRRTVEDVEAQSALAHARDVERKATREVERLIDLMADPELPRERFRVRLVEVEARVKAATASRIAAEARITPSPIPSPEALRAHARILARVIRGPDMADPARRWTLLRALLTRIVMGTPPRRALELVGPLFSEDVPLGPDAVRTIPAYLAETESTGRDVRTLRYAVGLADPVASG
jgi:site-specific DNA recombinase